MGTKFSSSIYKAIPVRCELIDYKERRTIKNDPFISLKIQENDEERTVSVFFNGDNGTLYEVFKEALEMAKSNEVVSKKLSMTVIRNSNLPYYYKCPLTFKHNSYGKAADINSIDMELRFYSGDNIAVKFKILNNDKDSVELLRGKLASVAERANTDYRNRLESNILHWNDYKRDEK